MLLNIGAFNICTTKSLWYSLLIWILLSVMPYKYSVMPSWNRLCVVKLLSSWCQYTIHCHTVSTRWPMQHMMPRSLLPCFFTCWGWTQSPGSPPRVKARLSSWHHAARGWWTCPSEGAVPERGKRGRGGGEAESPPWRVPSLETSKFQTRGGTNANHWELVTRPGNEEGVWLFL